MYAKVDNDDQVLEYPVSRQSIKNTYNASLPNGADYQADNGDRFMFVESKEFPTALDGVYTLGTPAKVNDNWQQTYDRRDYTDAELDEFAKAERKRREQGKITVQIANGKNLTFNVDSDSKANLVIIFVNAMFAKFLTDTDFSVSFSHEDGSELIDKDDILTVCNAALNIKGQTTFTKLAQILADREAGTITTYQDIIDAFNA